MAVFLDKFLIGDIIKKSPIWRLNVVILFCSFTTKGVIRLHAIGRKKKPPEMEKPPEVKIVALLDTENLYNNLPHIGPGVLSFSAGFDRVMKEIARRIGPIEDVYVFAPPHLVQLLGEEFYQQEFTIIACPKVHAKETGREVDTVDRTLIKFGEKTIRKEKGLTHLCIGSGDKDFAPFAREAIRQGLKILVIVSSKESLSSDLLDLADEVFLFSPIR